MNTEASVLSESELRCPVPLIHEARTVPFDVGYSRRSYTYGTCLRLLPAAAFGECKPRSASIGTAISVQVTAPDDLRYPASRPACKFGDTIVEAARPSSSEFGCQVPSLQPGVYELAVALDGVSFSHSIRVLCRRDAFSVKCGALVRFYYGGAFIEVSGSIRGSLLHTACLFGGIVSRALLNNEWQCHLCGTSRYCSWQCPSSIGRP